MLFVLTMCNYAFFAIFQRTYAYFLKHFSVFNTHSLSVRESQKSLGIQESHIGVCFLKLTFTVGIIVPGLSKVLGRYVMNE